MGGDAGAAQTHSVAYFRLPEANVDETDDLLEGDWASRCYTAALPRAREADDPDWVVVHGTVLSERAGKRIDHAWCERDGFVVGLALPVGARAIEQDVCYGALRPDFH